MLLGQDNNSNSGTGSLISFALLGALFIGYMWFTMPSAEEQEAKRAEAVRLEAERQAKEAAEKADTLDLKAIASAADLLWCVHSEISHIREHCLQPLTAKKLPP